MELKSQRATLREHYLQRQLQIEEWQELQRASRQEQLAALELKWPKHQNWLPEYPIRVMADQSLTNVQLVATADAIGLLRSLDGGLCRDKILFEHGCAIAIEEQPAGGCDIRELFDWVIDWRKKNHMRGFVFLLSNQALWGDLEHGGVSARGATQVGAGVAVVTMHQAVALHPTYMSVATKHTVLHELGHVLGMVSDGRAVHGHCTNAGCTMREGLSMEKIIKNHLNHPESFCPSCIKALRKRHQK
ncbi:MAG: hypothetical protein LBQ02_04595 [Candidatus Nomurabacteria bacterium]|nr:hypothetical protein [Candidatus Nomurabacteria bacterium]